jgi:hypothetical protein
MIKTKTQTGSIAQGTLDRLFNGVYNSTSTYGPYAYNPCLESIDTTTSDRRNKTNYVKHTKFFHWPTRPGGEVFDSSGSPLNSWKGSGWTPLYYGLFPGVFPSVSNMTVNPFSVRSLTSLQQDAARSLVPTFESGSVSLANFLYELKDFKRMFENWGKEVSFIKKNVLSRFYGNVRSIVWNDRHSIGTNLAANHLNLSFNILPGISDVKKIIKNIRTFDARYNKMVNFINKPVSRRYRTTCGTPKPAPIIIVQSSGYGDLTLEFDWVIQPFFCATSHIRYDIPRLGAWTKVAAAADSLGLNLNPQILWNAIPFSFVVDWFAKVGDLLGGFKQSNVKINTVVDDVSYSVKYRSRAKLTDYRAGINDLDLVLSIGEFQSYERWRGIYTPPDGLQPGSPGWEQGALGASLLTCITSSPKKLKR